MAIRNLRLLRLIVLHLIAQASVVAIVVAIASPNARAQTFDATSLGAPAEFGGTWLVHGGDDPAYAAVDLDDSRWLPFNPLKQSLHELYPKTRQEVVWYRLHIKVAPSQTGLALGEYNLASAFEVYLNGVNLFKVGQVAPFKAAYPYARLLARIPDEQIRSGSIILALRVHVDASEWSLAFPGYLPANLTLGEERSLSEHIWLAAIGAQSLSYLSTLTLLALSLGALLLYTSQRRQQEYLWLFLFGVSVNLPVPLRLYGEFHAFPSIWYAVNGIAALVWTYSIGRMYLAFLGQRVGWRWQLCLILASVTYTVAVVGGDLGLLSRNQNLFWEAPRILLGIFILPVLIVVQLRRGNREVGILLIPLLLSGAYDLVTIVADLLAQIPALRMAVYSFQQAMQVVHAGPFSISSRIVLNILVTLSLALIILLRSNSQSRQQALLESEMAAAKQVQQVILPDQIESVPGFTIESVYQPAQQVGGDFFQIIPLPGNSVVVCIGDVSGKGMPAAMTVSLLVGTLRTLANYTQSPGEILAAMNRQMVGRNNGGFTTCLVLRASQDGTVTIANAGHLAPYLDGRELATDSDLPLGLSEHASYAESTYALEPDQQLTLITDGVLEARSRSGELYGFERTAAISIHSAESISHAAQAFGQDDDITVLTLTLATTGHADHAAL